MKLRIEFEFVFIIISDREEIDEIEQLKTRLQHMNNDQ